MSAKLHRNMSVEEFDAGYYYRTELTAFARDLGIEPGNFRKFELERLIRQVLETGDVPKEKPVLPRQKGEARDHLALDSTVRNYVGDRRTKDFLLAAVREIDPNIRDKSGQWYWLNDWRRKKQEAGETFTYGDMVRELHRLMRTEGRLPQVPSARFNNFISDFLADPENKGRTRKDAIAAWETVKKAKITKTYEAYRASLGRKEEK